MTNVDTLNRVLLALGHRVGIEVHLVDGVSRVKIPNALIVDPIDGIDSEDAAQKALGRIADIARKKADEFERNAQTIFRALGQTPEEPAKPRPAPDATPAPDELVERLYTVYCTTRDADAATIKGPCTEERANDCECAGIRAILSELAKEPGEFPTEEEATAHVLSVRGARITRGEAGAVLDFARASIGPVLAAKDARRAELERLLELVTGQAATLSSRGAEYRGRIAELESAWDMLKKSLDESDLQRNEACARVAELEKRIADLVDEKRDEWRGQREHFQNQIKALESKVEQAKRFTDEWHEAVGALSELWPKDEPLEDNPPQGDWIRRTVAIREKRAKAKTLLGLRKTLDAREIAQFSYQTGIETIAKSTVLMAINAELAKLEGKSVE